MIVFAVVSSFASEAGRVFGPNGVDWAKGLGVFLWPSVLVTLADDAPVGRRVGHGGRCRHGGELKSEATRAEARDTLFRTGGSSSNPS